MQHNMCHQLSKSSYDQKQSEAMLPRATYQNVLPFPFKQTRRALLIEMKK